jgi:uncharacterized protein YodC (DUF2158 family)
MAGKWKPGDKTQVNPGGPRIKVDGYDEKEPDKVWGIWTEDGKIKRDKFHEDCLEPYQDDLLGPSMG